MLGDMYLWAGVPGASSALAAPFHRPFDAISPNILVLMKLLKKQITRPSKRASDVNPIVRLVIFPLTYLSWWCFFV